jgi:hypothetical protein
MGGSSPTSSSTSTGTGGGGLPPSQNGDGGACGYKDAGTTLHVAPNIDVCLPPVYCTSETCPPGLGQCVEGKCVFQGGYEGLKTLPEAWSTYYCDLSSGGCHGVTQIEFPEVTAQKIATAMQIPICDQAAGNPGKCVGIAASSPMVVGNSQVAKDPATGQIVSTWGLGMTEASGLCYELTGPGGTVVVALTDRCGGYCKCGGSGYQECGPCVSAPDMQPNCPCVGTVPGLYSNCCGLGCGAVKADCDWCASNNHPHFDLDTGAFNHLCGPQAGNGSCKLQSVKFVSCLSIAGWPPGGGGGGGCKANSYQCPGGAMPHAEQVPGTNCCCNYDQCPAADGSCGPRPAACKAGSCACGQGQPDANHPSVPGTSCCCISGLKPQADGSCQ